MENVTYYKKKIGIFGGSFDPIHQGHLNIARSAYEEFHLDEVWFIPAGHSPNKDETGMTSAADRAKMVELAIEEYPYFQLSMIEIQSSETSYTYWTLTKLTEQYPDIQFYFIMGADSLDYFENWRHPEIICAKAILLVAVRDELNLLQIEKKINELQKLFHTQIYPITGGKTDISSTKLRQKLRVGADSISMIPPKVAKYIADCRLYEKSLPCDI